MSMKTGMYMAIAILVASCSSSSTTENNNDPPSVVDNSEADAGNPGGSMDEPPGSNVPNDSGMQVGGSDISMRVGQIMIDEGFNDDDASIEGIFYEISYTRDALATLNQQLNQPADFCEVYDRSVFEDFPAGVGNPTAISAGEVITISSPEGSFTELTPTNLNGVFTSYLPSTNVSPPFPDLMTIDIPGDDFPAYSNIQLPRPTPVSGIQLSTPGSISSDTLISWNPVNDNSQLILILALYTVDESEASISLEKLLACKLQDDGEFNIPLDSAVAVGLPVTQDQDAYLLSFSRSNNYIDYSIEDQINLSVSRPVLVFAAENQRMLNRYSTSALRRVVQSMHTRFSLAP